MPTYVYECKSCEKVFEADQRITEDPLTDCTLCGAKGSLRRLIQPVGVMFKGSGFYINDSTSGSPAPEVCGPEGCTPAAAPAPKAEDAPTPAVETTSTDK